MLLIAATVLQVWDVTTSQHQHSSHSSVAPSPIKKLIKTQSIILTLLMFRSISIIRDRNVDKVTITVCVLMNFYYETFTNQMNLFTECVSTIAPARHNQPMCEWESDDMMQSMQLTWALIHDSSVWLDDESTDRHGSRGILPSSWMTSLKLTHTHTHTDTHACTNTRRQREGHTQSS